jgi:hypothetical protein
MPAISLPSISSEDYRQPRVSIHSLATAAVVDNASELDYSAPLTPYRGLGAIRAVPGRRVDLSA